MVNLIVEEGNSFLDGELKMWRREANFEYFVGMESCVTYYLCVEEAIRPL